MRRAFGVAVVALGLAGCGSVCDKFEDVSKNCGGTLNRASCDNALKSCSSSDQSILGDLADCLSKPSVCNNGKTVDQNAALACFNSANGLSTACSNALNGG